ncbi:hypothetical protein PLICRDRAFT_339831 [Plicaturopsis crispa FD-325 SS-3]|uniref:Uncharacterized protein n=1 Tax=Plicaturopsis crispa FD-325 SS-3 TaxID=944288 RepID=A0A0C9T933_PLICR|nr:hypothetical protein PLICRDRAFT_339831 [Plicaturopsis crispa FD-325 SS-3]
MHMRYSGHWVRFAFNFLMRQTNNGWPGPPSMDRPFDALWPNFRHLYSLPSFSHPIISYPSPKLQPRHKSTPRPCTPHKNIPPVASRFPTLRPLWRTSHSSTSSPRSYRTTTARKTPAVNLAPRPPHPLRPPRHSRPRLPFHNPCARPLHPRSPSPLRPRIRRTRPSPQASGGRSRRAPLFRRTLRATRRLATRSWRR